MLRKDTKINQQTVLKRREASTKPFHCIKKFARLLTSYCTVVKKKQITESAEKEKHWEFMKITVGKDSAKREWDHHLASLTKRRELTTLFFHKWNSVTKKQTLKMNLDENFPWCLELMPWQNLVNSSDFPVRPFHTLGYLQNNNKKDNVMLQVR